MQISVKDNTHDCISADPCLDPELFQEQFCLMIGLSETMPVAKALEALIGDWYPVTYENQESINLILANVASHNPQSFLEAQMLVQMQVCHRLCVSMLRKASKERWPESVDKFINVAMKLSRGFKSGMETLSKYKRDGRQYVYIERIDVEKDAQAVIGNVNKGGAS